MGKFINLHTHDAYGSLLDSILTPEQIVKYAADNNQTHIAITNHGYMPSFVMQVKACKEHGVLPIVGNEIYEVDNYLEKSDTKEYKQPRYHLILLAATQQGFYNLLKIVSEACTTGMYIKPRIDINWIEENNCGEGIICLTACQAGRLSRYLCDGKEQESIEYIRRLQNIFDYVVCEAQSHSTEDQTNANKLIIEFAQKYNLPYTWTTDAHMLNNEQLETHSIFVEIGEGRETGETYVDCGLQNDEDVYRILSPQFNKDIIQKGIEESAHIASMVEDIDYGLGKDTIMPVVEIPDNFNSHEEYLEYLVFKTFDEKFGHMSQEEQNIRKERLHNELPVLYELDYTDYFIMLYMISEEADKRGLPRGYSRGSGANCLCLFMLNVTQIDSVRWDLDFSRFANLGRKGSMADFDFDISKRRRKEIIELSEDLFGKENVAPMATFNTLATKVAVRDIGKVLNEKEDSPYYEQIPYSLRDEVAKMIPTVKTLNDLGEEEEKDMLLRDLLGHNDKLKAVYDQFPLWFKYIMELEGLPKSRGRHASGTLITPLPVTHYCPLCLDSEKNVMCQLEMHSAMDTGWDGLSLVKMDYLGLETLDVVDDTLKMAGLTWDDVDINHLNLAEKKVYDEVYKQGNTVGCFQMESYEARKMLIDAQADNIEDIVVVNAANRPGTKDSFPTYCSNKLHPESVQVIHEAQKDIFKKTHSILLYQEDALHLLAYAGFDEVSQETGRRAIGKKIPEKMKELEGRFREGLTEKQWTQKQQDEMWDLLLKQANYSFNRGHAVAYGLLSYLTGYLKTFHPVEFMTALLTAKSGDTSKLGVIINDCRRMKIKVLPPQINKSKPSFTANPEKNEILFGFGAIKGIGDSIITKIIDEQPYSSFDDYLSKIQDKTATIALIKANAFPIKDRMKLMQKYAKSLFAAKEYKPVVSLPTKAQLLLTWDINADDYKKGRGIDKEVVLKLYNQKRKEKFDEEQKIKYKKHMDDFRKKYATDEFLWEFQSLSMFVTDNPLEEAYELIGTEWDDVSDGDKVVVPCVIVDIKRKKDKNNNPFAYLDLCINNQILESTIWSRQLKEYSDLVKKGSCICILGRKKEGHLFVEKIKPYNVWLEKIKKLKQKANVNNY